MMMLTKKRSVAELHFLYGFDMLVWEREIPLIPCTVCVFEPGSKIANFDAFHWFFKNFFRQIIYLFVLEEERNGYRKI